jgi:uncharacterized protein
MHDFLAAFMGGLMLGTSVVGYLYLYGRVAGISGLIGQMLDLNNLFKTPAFWFLAGLIITPFIYSIFVQPEIEIDANPWMMVLAGVLVGFGTRLGSGCTSGHGICGLSRLSKRSMVATMVFMITGFATVYITRHLLGNN